jgi:peptidoglycan DL-endopeptidase LytE
MRRRTVISIGIVVPLLMLAYSNAFSAPVVHRVKTGENLSSLSKKYHVSVQQLKRLNKISAARIKPGQELIVKRDAPAPRPIVPAIRHKGPREDDGRFIRYKVKKGDTLEKIAVAFDVDQDEILESNKLTAKRLPRGKVILIPKVLEEKENEEELITLSTRPIQPWKSNDEKDMLVRVAKSFMGAPYRYGGDTVRGLDCSAFVKKIYNIFDVQLPRCAREQYSVGPRIPKDDLVVGDLVFFKTRRYAEFPTHVGIYIGDGNFIHAASGGNRLGVKIDSLSSGFYSKAYIGATRVKSPLEENPDTSKGSGGTSNNS